MSLETVFGLQDHKTRLSAKEQRYREPAQRVHCVLTLKDNSALGISFPQPPSHGNADLSLVHIQFSSSATRYGQHSPSQNSFSWSSCSCPSAPGLSLFKPHVGSVKHHTVTLLWQNKPVPTFNLHSFRKRLSLVLYGKTQALI